MKYLDQGLGFVQVLQLVLCCSLRNTKYSEPVGAHLELILHIKFMHQLFREAGPRCSWKQPPRRVQRRGRRQGWKLPGFSPPHSPPDPTDANRKYRFFGTCFGPAIMAVFVRKPKWDWFYSKVLNLLLRYTNFSDTPDDTENRAWIVRKAASEGKRTFVTFRQLKLIDLCQVWENIY